MDGTVCRRDHEIAYAEAVDVGCCGEVDAGRMWAVLVDAKEVLGYAEGGRGFGEEAPSDYCVLD